jgi:gamma-glutamyltranspeptidase/glutathione hydrolase
MDRSLGADDIATGDPHPYESRDTTHFSVADANGNEVQLVVNVIDHDLNIAEAAMRPRINPGSAGRPPELEGGYSPDVERLLEARGHRVLPSSTMGSTQSIMIDGDRCLGAANTRRPDALALGVR